MEHGEKQQDSSSRLTIVSRLDRLDLLMQFMEENSSLSRRRYADTAGVKKTEPECKCVPIPSALEEVRHKGTLLERIAMLENQVLQIVLEMDVGNTSRSSSSTAPLVGESTFDLLEDEFKEPKNSIKAQGSRRWKCIVPRMPWGTHRKY